MKIYLVMEWFHNTDPDFKAFSDKEKALSYSKEVYTQGVEYWNDEDPWCREWDDNCLFSGVYGEEGDYVQVWEIELDKV